MAARRRTGGRILVDQLRAPGRRHRVRRAGRELSRGPRRAARHARDPLRRLPPGRRRRDDGRRPGASSPAGPASPWSRAAPAPPTPAPACTSPSRTACRWSCSSARSTAAAASATPSRRSTTGRCSAAWPSGWPRSTTPPRIPEFVHRAFATATAGRPGPVVLALPEDMLVETADGSRWPAAPCRSRPRPRPSAMAELQPAARRRPSGRSSILGGGGWNAAGRRGAGRASSTPTTCRRPAASAARTCSTTTIAATPAISASAPTPSSPHGSRPATWSSPSAARLGETTGQGFTLLDVPRPEPDLRPRPQRSRGAGPRLPGRPRRSRPASTPSPRPRPRSPPPQRRPWADATARGPCRGAGLAGADAHPGPRCSWARSSPGCAQQLPPDAILTNGAGNYAIWANRHFAYRGLGTQLAPTSGSMGYGLPAAVAAKLRHPDRPVVCFAGDGCFLMTGQELATAVQYELADHRRRGRQRHVRHDPHAPGARAPGPRLRHRADATRTSRRWPAPTAPSAPGSRPPRSSRRPSRRRWPPGRPALLHLILDPEAITPRTSLSEIRAAARAAGR